MQHLVLPRSCIFVKMRGINRLKTWTGMVLMALLLGGCTPPDDPVVPMVPPSQVYLEVPSSFPRPDFPEDNAFDDVRWTLGKALFFDARLSLDGAVSCGSCHLPSRAFAAPEAVTPGAFGTTGNRNSSTLTNVAYQPYFMSEGGVPSLEMQVLVPLQEPSEMAHNVVMVCEELAAEYEAQSMAAYGRSLDPFVLTRALATFERSLLSGTSAWDAWQAGGATDPSVIRGSELFGGSGLGCNRCHAPPLFTSHGFANNGLDDWSEDPGRWRITGAPEDSGAFKIPTLRNIGFTAPYMHDGRFSDLDAVLDHYEVGGAGHAHQDSLLVPFSLTEDERTDLKMFLLALNDSAFVQDERWMQ